ncbi:MAG: hypothetical protein V4618_00915 [Pseudomonadota bacterium]
MKRWMLAAVALAAAIVPLRPLIAADVKISQMPSASTLAGTEKLAGVQSGGNVAITPAQIVTYAGATLQAKDSDLTAIAALATTSTGRDLLTSADAAGIRTKAGLGTIATQAASAVTITGGTISGITDLALADGGTGAGTASGARTNLGLVIGSDVQAYDAELAALAGVTSAANKLPYFSGSGTAAVTDLSSYGRTLIDDADAAAARGTLGIAAAVRPLVHPGYVASRWYWGRQASVAGGTNNGANTLRFGTFVVEQAITISDLGTRITVLSAGGKIQLGIYASDPATLLPTGSALAVTGDLATDTAVTVSGDIVGADVTLQPGLYWSALMVDNGTATASVWNTGFALASHQVGATSMANLSIGNTRADLGYYVSGTITFGTWPSIASITLLEAGGVPETAIAFKVSAIP